MKVYISSDSQDSFFVDNTLLAINEKNQEISSVIGIKIEGIYPPRQVATGMTIEDKVNQIKEADLVLMNITPRELEEEYFVNSGVLIEYGIVIGLDEKNKLSLFCDEQFERQRLSPIFHGHDIQPFGRENKGERLRIIIKDVLTEHIRTIIEQGRQITQRYKTAYDFIRQQIEAVKI